LSQPDLHPCPDEGRNGHGPLMLPPRRPGSEDHESPPAREERGHLFVAWVAVPCLTWAALLALLAVIVRLLRR
jgi:hypothetical protein